MLSGDNKPLSSGSRGELFDSQITQLAFTALDGCDAQQVDALNDLLVTITLMHWLTNKSQGLPLKKRNRVEFELIKRLDQRLNQPTVLADDLNLKHQAEFSERTHELVNELAKIAKTEHVSSHFKLLCARICLKFPRISAEDKTFWESIELHNQSKNLPKVGQSIFNEGKGKAKPGRLDEGEAPPSSKKRKI